MFGFRFVTMFLFIFEAKTHASLESYIWACKTRVRSSGDTWMGMWSVIATKTFVAT